MKNYLIVILTMVLSHFPFQSFSAVSNDTLLQWTSKYFTLQHTELSDNGRWATVQKKYDHGHDTVMVFDTSKRNGYLGNFTRMSAHTLSDDGYLLAKGADGVLWWNLKKNIRIQTKGSFFSEALQDVSRYFIYDYTNSIMTLYEADGSVRGQTERVTKYSTDKRGKLYLNRTAADGTMEIADFSEGKFVSIYKTKRVIKKMDIINPEWLVVTAQQEGTTTLSPIFINIREGTVKEVSNTVMKNAHHVTITMAGSSFLITYEATVKNSPMPDIWYGNDGELRNKKYPVQKRHMIWDPIKDSVSELPDIVGTHWASLNNSGYFANFVNGGTYYNYEHQKPELDLKIYDLQNCTYLTVGKVRTEMLVSPCGGYLVYQSTDGTWEVLQLSNMKKSILNGKPSWSKPTFSDDSRFVYFESSDGLIIFEIAALHKEFQSFGAGHSVQILNRNSILLMPGTEFFSRTVSSKTHLLLGLTNIVDNTVSYVLLKNGTPTTVLKNSADFVKSFKYSKDYSRFCSLEENYNMPPKLYLRKTNGKNTLLFDSSVSGFPHEKIRMEIYHYKSRDGKRLKGLLYYPFHYNTSAQYPMVVNIYQIQSKKRNHYPLPRYNSDIGHNLRNLLQRGYFVFLPDIVTDSRGPGIAAMDCVNRAMDAIADHPNINKSKVGLTGHSHGGFETNFIATQSSRFAAYISGAGNSDIVRSYFSYNYNFNSPFYWQFETGQYAMQLSFAENKQLYLENNPILNVDQVKSPILLWAGKKDENIAWDQVMEFYIGLRRHRKTVIALFYDQQGHAFPPSSVESADLTRRTLEWWDHFLKGKEAADWIKCQTEPIEPFTDAGPHQKTCTVL